MTTEAFARVKIDAMLAARAYRRKFEPPPGRPSERSRKSKAVS
jgi:hypothetical protein